MQFFTEHTRIETSEALCQLFNSVPCTHHTSLYTCIQITDTTDVVPSKTITPTTTLPPKPSASLETVGELTLCVWHTHTCTHTCTHKQTHTHTHTHMYTYAHTHTHVHTQTDTHTHTHAHIHIRGTIFGNTSQVTLINQTFRPCYLTDTHTHTHTSLARFQLYSVIVTCIF